MFRIVVCFYRCEGLDGNAPNPESYAILLPPGLYWYRTHPLGESYQQSLDGMSGAIVVEGIAQYVPRVARMTEQILVLRDFALDEDASSADALSKVVGVSHTRCGEATGQPSRIFTVNGVIRPRIQIAPGEVSFGGL